MSEEVKELVRQLNKKIKELRTALAELQAKYIALEGKCAEKDEEHQKQVNQIVAVELSLRLEAEKKLAEKEKEAEKLKRLNQEHLAELSGYKGTYQRANLQRYTMKDGDLKENDNGWWCYATETHREIFSLEKALTLCVDALEIMCNKNECAGFEVIGERACKACIKTKALSAAEPFVKDSDGI